MNEKENNTWILEALCDSIVRLAWAPAKQIEYLRNRTLPLPVDELALQLSDVSILVPQLLKEGLLTVEQCEAIYQLDGLFLKMSGQDNSYLWNEDALMNDKAWTHIRELASIAMKMLDCAEE